MFTSSSPLYVQLKNYIIRYIEIECQYNDQISSEYSLMEKYSVSRTTVRRAIDELVKEGYLYKKQGLGTYVSGEKIEQGLVDLSSCTYEMRKMGFDPMYNMLSEEVINAKVSVASKLKINVGEEVFHIQRISIANEEPLNLTHSFIPYKYVPNIEQFDFSKLSLYKILKEEYNIELIRSVRSIEAILADEELSIKLNIKEGKPLLKFNGQVTAKLANEKEVMLEHFRTFYRTDKVKFYAAQT